MYYFSDGSTAWTFVEFSGLPLFSDNSLIGKTPHLVEGVVGWCNGA